MKAATWVAAPAIVVLIGSCGAARADVKITVTYIEVEREIAPNVAVHRVERKRELILTSDHKIRSTYDYGDARHSDSGTIALGAAHNGRTFNGVKYSSRWYIEKGAIVRVGHTDSTSSYMRITTNGRDSCDATISFALNRGHKIFSDKRMSNGEEMQMDDIHAENATCAIAQVGG